ncbi:MAG: FtsQ-type POTRA domain-containing protein [Acidobacteria bacterium]|nr:FtsQ-type POTRA domain-containing protein [Acidobacteriota bacterium]
MSEFFRPADVVTRTRNRRRQRVRAIAGLLANVLVVGSLVGGGWLVWTNARSDERFSINRVELDPSPRSDDPEVLRIIEGLKGRNLFSTDLDSIRAELGGIDGIREATVEKVVPDGLRIAISERRPVAIWRATHGDVFVDETGREFRTWSGAEEAVSLPSIVNAESRRIAPAVRFIAELRQTDPELAGALVSLEPLEHDQWAIVDSRLGTTIKVAEKDVIDKWRLLYAIALREQWEPQSVAYADLRFERQIVVNHDIRRPTGGSDHGEK